MKDKEKDVNVETKDGIGNKLLNIALYVLFGLAVVLTILKLFFFGYYNVNGESMMPTFHEGEKFIAPLVHESTELERDDVVIVKTPDIYIIKRLVGLPGDTVEIKDGKVYVNDELREGEQETYYYINNDISQKGGMKVTLKEDEYFVLGDNRDNSADSRNYGAFSKEDIKAVYHRDMVKE